ncbi:hypothetical protein ASE01_11310 [Nocardioides sp. Root190]|uniref:hypothetical protein n=1 Tax=Nocardioides sp. Root190 TaxID=1736488 RepID=UPI0006F52A0E|nr:hypothetical protein [Nocardioides sp. Root190]KRB77314.1 hypothetical protein ASE01_11310 [Nocardioides sp. Root190]
MSEMADDEKTVTASEDVGSHAGSRSLALARLRDTAGRVAWIICVTLALVLAAAAFTFALEANEDNGLVQLVRDLGSTFDLGFFDLDNPVKAFENPNGEVKTALFNYGLASVVYLVLGRILERVIRP